MSLDKRQFDVLDAIIEDDGLLQENTKYSDAEILKTK